DPHGTQDFTAIDIRKSDTFTYDFTKTFNKPAPTNATVASEYDKVSSQPLKTLHYAGVLSAERRGSTIAYELLDLDILTTIASRELKTYRFLVDYLISTNEQSTLTPIYESFYCSPQSQADFHAFKTSYIRYILRNTRINRDVEVRRILPKALNPIA